VNWFKRIFTRRICLEVKITDMCVYPSCVTVLDENNFTIWINLNEKCGDVNFDYKTVLAHEMGHLIDHIDGKFTKQTAQAYTSCLVGLGSSLPVVKFEASAWRNAHKIYPGLSLKTLKTSFKSYLRNFRP
jgi:hypothetical protein